MANNLPTSGSDSGTWGDKLNAYLQTEHSATGGHTDITASSVTTTGDITAGDDLVVGGDASVDGFLGFTSAGEVTISSGAVTASSSYHTIDTEGNAASDELATINGGVSGNILVIRAEATGRTVVAKDGTGNLRLNGDFSMDSNLDTLTLIKDGTLWIELCRSNNA